MNRKLTLGILVSLLVAGLFSLGLARTNSSLHVAAAARRIVLEQLGPEVRIVELSVYYRDGDTYSVTGAAETVRGWEGYHLVLRWEQGKFRPITASFGGETVVFRR